MESEKDAVARLTGDLQWGVKGAPFAEYGADDATGALFPKGRGSSVALSRAVLSGFQAISTPTDQPAALSAARF